MQDWLDLPLCCQMTTNLQAATNVGAGDHICSRGSQISCFELAESCGFSGLHDVVNPCTAATHPGFRGLSQSYAGDCHEQLPGLRSDALAMNHVAGIVISHLSLQWLEPRSEVLTQPQADEELMHVQNRR